MPKPGDVVIGDFTGALGVKRRPLVVVSSDGYHAQRPDVILGIITTNRSAATSTTDCILQDWRLAGLHAPSAFRSYLGTSEAKNVKVIGHLSDRDWQAVQDCLRKALG